MWWTGWWGARRTCDRSGVMVRMAATSRCVSGRGPGSCGVVSGMGGNPMPVVVAVVSNWPPVLGAAFGFAWLAHVLLPCRVRLRQHTMRRYSGFAALHSHGSMRNGGMCAKRHASSYPGSWRQGMS